VRGRTSGMAERGVVSAPVGLGAAGAALWGSIVEPREAAGWRLDEREAAVLEAAAHQADDVAALEAQIEQDGRTVAGSRGQTVLHPGVSEVRQGRIALGRLLGQLALPDGEDVPRSSRSLRAQAAAQSRWKRQQNGGEA